jgi:transposase
MTYSIKDVQQRYGVGEGTVLGWIRQGHLRATNVAKKLGTRPKWRVSEAALTAFEELRAASPPPAKPRRGRQRNEVMSFIR